MKNHPIKSLFTAVLLIILFSSCKTSFRGEVIFKTSIRSNDPDQNQVNYYVEKYGDTLVIDYHKNGDMIRSHKNGLLDYQYFNAEKGEIYYQYHNSRRDTFQSRNFSLNHISFNEREAEMIMGEECECYQIVSTLKSRPDTVVLEACYPKSKDFYLDPELYINYHDYYLLQLFRLNQSPYFKFYIHYPEVSIFYDGIEVKNH